MAAIFETTMTLRFFGDDLDPEEITTRLGRPPSVGAVKGGVWRTGSGREKVARTGVWLLIASKQTPGDLDKQITKLFSSLSDDLSIWRDLTTRFEADVFCGLFMQESNEGISLSTDAMATLSSRNLEIDFDVYDPGSSE